jgi:hypothetical protein
MTDTIRQIGALLRKYYIASDAVIVMHPIYRAAIARLAELVHLDVEKVGASAVIREAEITAAPDILRGEPDETLLAALDRAQICLASYSERQQGEAEALQQLREALLALPNPPSQDAVTAPEDCEALAAHLVCREWIANHLQDDDSNRLLPPA